MIRLSISEEDTKELRYQRYHHPHPRVQQKMESVYLKSFGLPHHLIASIVGVTETTLRSYLLAYAEGGIAALERFETGGSTSELAAHTTSLVEEFNSHPPQTVNEAVQRIEELTGIRRSPTQVREWLKKTGLGTGKPRLSQGK